MKKHVLVQFAFLLAACAGANYSAPEITNEHQKRTMVLRIHPVADLISGLTDFIPPQITQVGVNEDAETPLFGGVTSGHSHWKDYHVETYVQDFDIEITQAVRLDDNATAALANRMRTIPEPSSVGTGWEPGVFFGRKRAPAETKTWKRSRLAPHTSKLTVGDKETLPLKAMKATVRIEGFRARVTLDMFFFNDRKQQLEGNFKVRLPNGAMPVRLGFGDSEPAPDLEKDAAEWKAPKEARVVPRERAAHAYTETVRRKVDPALLEWSGAGVFSARVFPLLPKKMHRIALSYQVNLVPVGDELEYRLDLPKKISALLVDIKIHGKQHILKRNPGRRTFRVRIKNAGAVLMQGKDYFAASFVPAVPVATGCPASRAVFLVDVSLSSNPDRFNVWLKLLEAILERNRPTLKEFTVGFFNIETFWWRKQFAPNTAEHVREVLKAAGALSLEGATDLGQALDAAARFDGDVFLLSDGAPTWGEDNIHALKAHRPVFAYATALAGTNGRVLSHLARESGGAVFSVVGEAQIPAAAVAHTRRPWRIESVRIRGGRDLLLAGRPRSLFPGQRLQLVGRGHAQGKIELKLRQGDAVRTVETNVRHVSSGFAGSAYGQIAVGQLEALGDLAEDTARAYATHFRVVGQTCSLLMLDTEEDYKRFGIKPDEDALVVRENPASRVVRTGLERIGSTLSDPKARLLAWLDGLESRPGMRVEMLSSLRLALRKMPASAFDVRPERIRCRERRSQQVPLTVVKQLASRKLDYEAITKEAGRRREKYGAADALRILSSLVEHSPGDFALARDVGYSAMELGLGAQAYHLFRRVAERRPYEPQTYLAMAACLETMGNVDLARLYYEVALAGKWDTRFGGFDKIVRLRYLRMLRRTSGGHLADFALARQVTIGKELNIDSADLVVTIAWNTDRTDVDLHVVDPNGEDCYYGHRVTKIGGRITPDVTQGFGPELFLLKKGIRGEYRVKVHYFARDANRASARTKVYATVYENWGRSNERVRTKTVTLRSSGGEHEIALVERQ